MWRISRHIMCRNSDPWVSLSSQWPAEQQISAVCSSSRSEGKVRGEPRVVFVQTRITEPGPI
ncbi:hypothetical protein INR49_007485 [Caranx melampygus]|nr:hypothetical protein INR49_010428 [Caranx melampygus]KAG7233107.1 hypothetical protein INR49_007485 [Caranx melampygus]